MTKFSELPKPEIKKTGIFSKNGMQVVSAKFKGRNFTREEIKYLAKDFGKKLSQKMSGEVMVCLKYPERWYSGKKGWTKLGDSVILHSAKDYNEEDPETYPEFIIFIKKDGKKAGGANNNNSCFYDSLKELLGDKTPWSSDKVMKNYLGLNESDMVTIEKMELIQKELPKYKLIITGDEIWISTNNSHLELHIELIDNHFSPLVSQPTRVYGIAETEKVPLIYKSSENGSFYWAIDGNKPKKYKLSNSDYNFHWKKPRDSPYTLIPYDPELGNFKQNLNHWIEKADIYKKGTNGLINFYKTGTNNKTILQLFYTLTKDITKPEKIEQDEAEWILKASTGSIIYGEYYKGKAYDYDIVSMYPSLLSNPKLLFPIKRGKWHQLTNAEFINKEFYQYGIYHCKIEKKESEKKLFRWNKLDYYTHFDLNLAKKLGLQVTLIEDDNVNALIYSRDCLISSKKLFGNYVDLLFPLKQKGIIDSKLLLNNLWGLLCQCDKFIMNKKENAPLELFDGSVIHEITPSPTNSNNLKIKLVKKSNYFKTDFARIKPFILSRARLHISTIMLPHKNFIKRVHTDGFISTEKLDIITGNELGDLKYKGYCENVIVKNSMKVEGKFLM